MSMMLGHLYVHCMGSEKWMSKVVMIPGIPKRDLEKLTLTYGA